MPRKLKRPLPHGKQPFRAVSFGPTSWRRLHWPGGATAYVASSDHRFTPSGVEKTLYLATHEWTSALEIFGDRCYDEKCVDIPLSEWEKRQFSVIQTERLKLADLCSPRGLLAARVDVSSLADEDVAVPQAWAQAVFDSPKQFHGLIYASRFTKKKCLALFEARKPDLTVTNQYPLDGSAAANQLLKEFCVNLT